MKVLSLFNGMSVCHMALEQVSFPTTEVYISEINPHANKASETLFPNQIQLGSVCDWRAWDVDWSSVDLVTGGFPCQAWSVAGRQLGDKDERGMLFWVMLDIIKKVLDHNPKAHFLIENVKMKREFEEYITHHTRQALGVVYKTLIDSALVSAQNRKRYYWTSYPTWQPDDECVVLADILEVESKEMTVKRTSFHGRRIENTSSNRRVKAITENERGYRPHQGDKAGSGLSELGRILKLSANKTDTLTTSHSPKLAINADIENLQYVELTLRECMRLQTIPECYINELLNAGISKTQLKIMTGNSWTMAVIEHLFYCLLQHLRGL